MDRLLKRALDILVSLIALVVLSPLFLVVMALLRCSGEGEVFFRQKRIGFRNKPFGLWKFVTMRKDSPETGTITAAGDPRILPLGHFLRKSKINELPQLINVLKGDMSIVGPRPLTDETFDHYPEQMKPLVYRSVPGLTGIGSVVFRHEESILAASPKDRTTCYREDITPIKGALEVWYFEHRSTLVDLKIILLTAIAILFPGNQLHLRFFRDLPLGPAPLPLDGPVAEPRDGSAEPRAQQ